MFKNQGIFIFLMVLSLILQSLYFFLPAYFANMAPIIFRWLPGGHPVSIPLFGENKTWRGLIIAPVAGGLIFWIQKATYQSGFQQLAIIDYADFSILLGFLLGIGAILGDLVKSYYKRKAGLKPGHPWIPWDQSDFVVGGLLGSFVLYVPPADVALVLLIFSPLLHIVVNHLAYWWGIRKEKW